MAEYIYRTKWLSLILEKRRVYRLRFMMSKVNTWPGMSILDVGCGPDGRSFENHVSEEYVITGIDLKEPSEVKIQHPHFTYYKMDAKDLSVFGTKTFDLAISIGMMEHVCERESLQHMANEIERVAKQWLIVVPWQYCPVESHFKFPFFQLLPEKMQVSLTRLFNLHNLRTAIKDNPSYIRENYQWLSRKQWKKIFKADRAYILPSLDAVVIAKKE